jgi:hypothetical protein
MKSRQCFMEPFSLRISAGLILFLITLTGTSWGVSGSGLGLRVEKPYIAGFHPLDEEVYAPSPLTAPDPVLLNLNTKLLTDTTQIDFEKRQISFLRTDELGFTIWQYHYGELSDYLLARRNYALNKNWRDGKSVGQADASKAGSQGLKLEWELPVQYPSWAQRVLGNEPPRLKVDGSLEIILGYERTYNPRDPQTQNTAGGIKFDQNYDFSISGSVGRLINISISASSQQDFQLSDNLKKFKIEYKESSPGELEDEIIQEVIAGYTGFEMPGTSLSGYSESKEGLFGIKIKAKLGPLTLTGIASTEQGESEKKSLSNQTGAGGEIPVRQDQYWDYKYFFLDTTYRHYYNRKYALKNAVKNPTLPPKITDLQVWLRVDAQKKEQIKRDDPSRIVKPCYLEDQSYDFELLKPERDYKLNPDEGYIQFLDSISIQSNDVIGIYLRTSDGSISRGTDPGADTSTLWALKPEYLIDDATKDPRFYLVWKNVFKLDASNINSMKLRVVRKNQSEQKEYNSDDKGKLYSETMGLTDKTGTPLRTRSDIFVKEYGVMIIPPYDTSFMGNDPFSNPDFGEFKDTLTYTFSSNNSRRVGQEYPFTIYMNATIKQTTFNLDYGVMQNTEKVTADNVVLSRDKDYTINYEMGTLELTSARAKAAEKVDIEYQRDALFVPEKKIFLGLHGQMDLPFLSDRSFIGASILYQDTKSSEDIPRLGMEPYSKLLFDVNTKVDFQPEWMTKLVNKIPLIRTEAASSVTMELEVANSRMSPNTADNAQAYVDNFEEAKQSDPLIDNYLNWYRASPPYSEDSLPRYPPAWDFYWFTPVEQDQKNRVMEDSIYKPKEGERPHDKSGASVLKLTCQAAPDSIYDRFKNAWAGIMYPIPVSYSDKTHQQFFEFIANTKNATGKLEIQMGEMREDVSLNGGPPNHRWNREDTSYVWTGRDDPNLDIGLDGLRDTAEYYLVPNATGTGWDTLHYGDPFLGPDSLDPSKDNWKLYDIYNTSTYRYACRTEGDQGKLETEDINFDGSCAISIPEKYYKFIIDLKDTNAPYVDTAGLKPGWRRYRIPLKELLPGLRENFKDSVGSPDWKRITMVRLVWNKFDERKLRESQSLLLTGMEFVGNQWESKFDDPNAVKISASVINNQDDPIYLKNKPFKPRLDAVTNLYDKEQSLKLRFKGLVRGDTAIVIRKLFQKVDLSSYDSLTLMYYGVDSGNHVVTSPLYNGQVKFVFRFGSNDSTYYQYTRPIYPGWRNNIAINLKQIAALKDSVMNDNPDSAICVNDGFLSIRSPKGREYKPNFANITWIAVGVLADAVYPDSVGGEIWVDEMKVCGIKNLNGWAARANIDTKWADLLSISANMNYTGGDFRTMTENSSLAADSKLSGAMNAEVKMDKFLPADWGVSIPVGTSVSAEVTRPQLKTGTDVYLTDSAGKADDFLDMANDAVDAVLGSHTSKVITDAERYGTRRTSEKVYVNYSKTAQSTNPLVDLTADRITTDFAYSKSVSETQQGRIPHGSGDYVAIDSSDTYTGRLGYDLSPHNPPSWTKWRPLEKSKQTWAPKLNGYEFSLLPSKIDFDLLDVTYGYNRHYDTKQTLQALNTRSFNVNHAFAFEYSPINPLLNLTYDLNINRDLMEAADSSAGNAKGLAGYVLKFNETWADEFILWGEKTRSQNAKFKLSPEIFDWLTTSADYNSDYKGDITQLTNESGDLLNTSVNTGLNFNSSLDIGQIFTSLISSAKDSSLSKKLLTTIKQGFDQIGLGNFEFTYSAISNLNNYNFSTDLLRNWKTSQFYLYQLGLQGRGGIGNFLMGDMDDSSAIGGMRTRDRYEPDNADYYKSDKRTITRNYRISTGLNLKFPFEISFSPITLGFSKALEVRPDTAFFDTSTTSPEFSIGAQTSVLQKVDFINKFVTGVSMNSTYSFKNTNRLSNIDTSKSTRHDFSPLISLNGTVRKWPIRFNYQHTESRETRNAGDKSKTITSDGGDELDLSYELEKSSGLSEIKILKWTIPVKGRTTTGLKFSRTGGTEDIAGQKQNKKSISFHPYLSYIFTDNITGKVEYTYSDAVDVKGDETNTNDFSIIVNWTF